MGFKERRSVAPHPGPLPKGEGKGGAEPVVRVREDATRWRRSRPGACHIDVVSPLSTRPS
ncbi:hypothetical protein LNP74_08790 [Klebsiella pneumoniae subsp. pneumoniae]|nr:hypothetical protein [Klebsiella pneumoniae subsp. pneumoniae]